MSKEALRRLEELSQMTNLYDAKHYMSRLSQSVADSNMIKQIRMNSALMKSAAMMTGKDKIDGLAGHGAFDNIAQGTSYAALLGFPQSGGVVTAALLDAQKRAVAARQGSNANGVVNNYDTAAAGMNSVKNLSNVGKNAFYMSTAGAGAAKALGYNGFFGADGLQSLSHASQNAFAFGPAGGGMLASKMLGGTEALGGLTGGAMSKLLATAGVQGVTINPMLAGVATMMALSKGTSALHKMVNDKSSINQSKNNRSVIFHSKHPHQLEDEYGATMFYRNLIAKMQSTGQMDTQTAILGQLLAAIEGHTSVLPLLTAEFVNKDKRSEKQSNKALNHLSDVFGDDGTLRRGDQSLRNDPGIIFKVANGFEKFTSQFQSTFDIMGQISNTLNGKSSTALSNEARDIGKTEDLLEAQKDFGRKYGISTGMVQAIHTTPSEIMDKADTYEGRVLSILGLISEINRFSAHELLQIRTKGFGLNSAESSSYLAKAQQLAEERRMAKDDSSETYNRWFRGIDETLGMIPGWNVLSGTAKMGKDIWKTGKNLLSDDPEKHKTMSEYFNNWILKGHENANLGSAEALQNAIGAKELSAEQRMASYLGFDYPDKIEDILMYLHHIDESTASLAGNINRTDRHRDTMNNFTGLMGRSDYHDKVNSDIYEKLENEFETLNSENATFFQSLFGSDTDTLLKNQRNKFFASNPDFLKNLNTAAMNSGGTKTENRNDLQSIQEAQDLQVQQQRQLSVGEQQLATLFEIRDILAGGKKGKKSSNANPQGLNSNYSSLLGDLPDIGFGVDRTNTPNRNPKQNKFQRWYREFQRTAGGSAATRRAAATKFAGRLLTAGMAELGPFVRIAGYLGAAYSAYKLYEYFTEDKFEEKIEDKLEKKQDKADAEFKAMPLEKREGLNKMIQDIEKFDTNNESDKIIQALKSKDDQTLRLMLSMLKATEDPTDEDKYLIIQIEKLLHDREHNKSVVTMDAAGFKKLMKENRGSYMKGELMDSILGKSNMTDNKELKEKMMNQSDSTNETKEDVIRKMQEFKKLTTSDIEKISTTSKSDYLKYYAKTILKADVSRDELNNFTDENLGNIFEAMKANKVSSGTSLEINDLKTGVKKETLKYEANVSEKTQQALADKQGSELVENFAIEVGKALKETKAGESAGISATEMQKLQVIIDAITKKTGTNEFQTQFNDMLHILASQHVTTAEALTAVTKLASRSTGSTDMQKKIASAVTNN